MKNSLLFFYLLMVSSSYAQTGLRNPGSILVDGYDSYGRPITDKSKLGKGSPMLNDEWAKGWVKLASGRLIKDMFLRFNIYSNQLQFRIDSIAFTCTEAVNEFGFTYEENGSRREYLFRNGYSVTDPEKAAVFYQVLMEDEHYQLLKYHYKQVIEQYDYKAVQADVLKENSELLIYDTAAKSIKKVKNRQAISGLWPGKENEIALYLVKPGNH